MRIIRTFLNITVVVLLLLPMFPTQAISATSFDISDSPGGITAGASFSITVTAKNADNSTDTGYAGTVYFSSSASSAILPAPYTFVSGDNGTHTFLSEITINTAGSQTIRVSSDNSLEGYWKLDEETGLTAADESVNGNTATLNIISPPTWNTDVPVTQFSNTHSLSFSGTANYVSITKTPALLLSTSTTTAWVKANSGETDNNHGLFSDETLDSGYACYIEFGTGFFYCTFNGSSVGYLTSNTALNDGAWHHVALAIDNAAGTATIYVDGVSKASANVTLAPSPDPLLFGQIATYMESSPFLGLLDDLRIYNRALSQSDIAALVDPMDGGVASIIKGISPAITVSIGAPATVTAVAGTPQGALANASFAFPLQAMVSDAGNNPLSGVEVTFSVVPVAGAAGTFPGGLPSIPAFTDVNGIAASPTFTANSTLGSYAVTASVSGIPTPAVFNLTNYEPPSITVQPQPVTIVAGDIPNLSVIAGGTPPLTYQWYQGAKGDITIKVTGATSYVFNQPVTSTGTYWVRVSNFAGVDSEAVLVTVNQPAKITIPPQNKTIQRGETTQLNVTATGDGTLGYQWYQGVSGITSLPIPGATTNSYTTPALNGSASYWVRVTGDYGTPADSTTAQVIIPATLGTRANSNAITINDNAAAYPYPSSIVVSGVTGTVDLVRVTLKGVSHTWPFDIGVLLVGPLGQKVVLMDGTGGGNLQSITGVDLTFDDTAGSSLTYGQIVSGTYRPTNLETSRTFPGPDAAGPYAANLAAFNGVDPNGTWQLYVRDAQIGDAGSISGGWEIEFLTKTYSLSINVDNPGHGFVTYTEKPLVVYTSDETSVISGEQVTLDPHPDQYYTLSWSGVGTTCTTGTCQFNMNSNTTATAAFNIDSANSVLVDPVHLHHASIDAAYKDDTTSSYSVIKLWGIDYAEKLLFGKGKTVTLKGNYNSSFDTQNPGDITTTITVTTDPVRIKAGTVIVDRIKVK